VGKEILKEKTNTRDLAASPIHFLLMWGKKKKNALFASLPDTSKKAKPGR